VADGRRVVAAIAVVWSCAAALARVAGIWVSVGGAAVLLGAALLATRRATLAPWLRPTPASLLLGGAAGVVMSLATVVLGPVLLLIPGGADQLALLYAGFAALPPWAALLLLAPIIAGEELVWRGVVQRTLAGRLGELRAVAAAAALYGVAHAPIGSWVLCLAAAGCGVVWSALAARTRGLAAPFVAHVVWDVAVLFVAPISQM
jgi:membrane protease YdiL (CAAX protease family)